MVGVAIRFINLIDYNDWFETEFEGYVQRIATDDGSITLGCEDGIYLTRKPVADKAFKASTVKEVAEYIAAQVGGRNRTQTQG